MDETGRVVPRASPAIPVNMAASDDPSPRVWSAALVTRTATVVNRRAFVTGILGLLAALLAAAAQQAESVPRIGLLEPGSLAGRAPLWEAFRRGMRELGYVEGFREPGRGREP
jgi:hypothetical protein